MRKRKKKKKEKVIISMNNYALSHEYFVEVFVQLVWQPRTRRVRGSHSNWTQTSTKYEGDNAIVTTLRHIILFHKKIET